MVEALQVLHEEEQGRPAGRQRTVHLTLLIESGLQAGADPIRQKTAGGDCQDA